jgi:deoxyribodipyrimidine photolyase-related protein
MVVDGRLLFLYSEPKDSRDGEPVRTKGLTLRTVWILGDQLNRRIGAMAGVRPRDVRVLMVESESMLFSRPYHRQRLHLVLTTMRRFASELRSAGFQVDYQRAETLSAGLRRHRDRHGPTSVVATEPNSRKVEAQLLGLDVELMRSNQFLCHRDDFADWAGDRNRLRMEDFYRRQRQRLGYLMDGDEPAGGRWNFDHDNREPPPRDGGKWPKPPQSRLDHLDREVMDGLPEGLPGAAPVGWWATSRRAALSRLKHFTNQVLPGFGPHEDAMLTDNWHLAHSLLSPYMNLGLLLPGEVCDAVEVAYRATVVPFRRRSSEPPAPRCAVYRSPSTRSMSAGGLITSSD